MSSKPDAEPVKSSEICQRAQENLQALRDHARLPVRNDQGDMEFITDEQRRLMMGKSQALIDRHCD